jgi:hypothetical protein
MSPATASHAGGIHTIEKPRRVRRKPKFLCRTCEGDHLTRLCPATAGYQKHGPYLGALQVLSHLWFPNTSLVDTTVMPMQSSADTPLPLGVMHLLTLLSRILFNQRSMSMQSSTDTTPIFGGDASLDLVVSHPIQPMVEEVVTSMQFSVDPSLLVLVLYLLYHVISISSTAPSEQERVLLSPSTLPPSLGEVPFDWDGLVGYPMPPPMSFQVRDII